MSVSGRTTTNEARQSNSLDHSARLSRVATSGGAAYGALYIQRKLPAQEQVLSGDDPRGPQCHEAKRSTSASS